MTSLWSLKYPVQNVWNKFSIPFVGNDTIVWKGQVAIVIDADGTPWQTDALTFDTPWYHCAACETRLSLGSNYCARCGAELDWNLGDKDPEAIEAFNAETDAKVKKVTQIGTSVQTDSDDPQDTGNKPESDQ